VVKCVNSVLTSCAKGIARSELPHTSKQLCETTAEECHPDDNVGRLNTTGMDIVKREDQRRGREGKKPTIKTRLELDHAASQRSNTQDSSQGTRVAELNAAGRSGLGVGRTLSVINFRGHFC
jgi:hypothetical protein